MSITNYFKAVRPMTMFFFLEVLFGILYSLNFKYALLDLPKLILVFISFETLYRSIYVINDLIDYESDKKHPKKSRRIIASGKISKKNAFIFAMVLIIIAFIIASFTSLILVYFELVFLSYNLIYSFILKKIPIVYSFASGVTHAMRFALGMSLFAKFTNYYFVFSIFILVSGLAFLRRFKEITGHEKIRHPLKYYSVKNIKLIWILLGVVFLLIILISRDLERILIIIVFMICLFFIIGYSKIKIIKNFFNRCSNY